MSITGVAGYLARRAAQKERVRILYRRTLKDTLNWAVHRHLFYQDVLFSLSIYHLLLIAMIVLQSLGFGNVRFEIWVVLNRLGLV
jgi:hypothetical protein